MKDSTEFKQRFKRWQEGEKVYEAGKILPKYDDGTDDKTYLPEYEYEATVTPQGTSLEKHKRITNEEDWQKYWGDVGAGYVSQAQEAAAPVVLNGMSMLMGNPLGAFGGLVGSTVGEELGANLGPTGRTIGGLVGGVVLDPANIRSSIDYIKRIGPHIAAKSARQGAAFAYQFFPNKTENLYKRLLSGIDIGDELTPLHKDIDVYAVKKGVSVDPRYIGNGSMHVVVQNPNNPNTVLKFGTEPISKERLQRRILSLRRVKDFKYLEPEKYIGYTRDTKYPQLFYEVLEQNKIVPKDKTQIFDNITKRMKSEKVLSQEDKEQYDILNGIYKSATQNGADTRAFEDMHYINHNGSTILDFGHRHNIGYNQKGEPIIFDPQISTPKHVGLVDMLFPRLIGYDKGKSIHINPANRGKFKATMKRTGKSAEELSHSKNPLTRKRAIFALNSRKWSK